MQSRYIFWQVLYKYWNLRKELPLCQSMTPSIAPLCYATRRSPDSLMIRYHTHFISTAFHSFEMYFSKSCVASARFLAALLVGFTSVASFSSWWLLTWGGGLNGSTQYLLIHSVELTANSNSTSKGQFRPLLLAYVRRGLLSSTWPDTARPGLVITFSQQSPTKTAPDTGYSQPSPAS